MSAKARDEDEDADLFSKSSFAVEEKSMEVEKRISSYDRSVEAVRGESPPPYVDFDNDELLQYNPRRSRLTPTQTRRPRGGDTDNEFDDAWDYEFIADAPTANLFTTVSEGITYDQESGPRQHRPIPSRSTTTGGCVTDNQFHNVQSHYAQQQHYDPRSLPYDPQNGPTPSQQHHFNEQPTTVINPDSQTLYIGEADNVLLVPVVDERRSCCASRETRIGSIIGGVACAVFILAALVARRIAGSY